MLDADQVKIFSSSYVRWFRDIPPPSDDVPVSLALSDAGHAVTLTKQLMGPVHLNIQFRENLAPDAGLIRNDDRIGSVTNFHTLRFTDVPGFVRWSQGGNRWLDTYYPNNNIDHSVLDVAELILQSRRGIIVTGNLRSSGVDGNGADSMSATIEYFAELIGMPILAGVQSGALRREHSVVPYAEHILKHPSVSKGLQPDLILQLGTPLISTEISKIISDSIRRDSGTKHVLVQRFFPYERADPDFTVTHRISSDIGVFLKSLTSYLESLGPAAKRCSELTPLLYLGRELQKEMPSIIEDASHSVNSDVSGNGLPPNDASLIEPHVMTAISEVLSETSSELSTMSLFLSNSMPVRDGEFFMYPTKMHNSEKIISANVMRRFPLSV